MRCRLVALVSLLLSLAFGCVDRADPRPDAGSTTVDASAAGDAQPPRDGGAPPDAGEELDAASPDGGAGCMPSEGSLLIEESCADVTISVLAHSLEATRVRVGGRLGGDLGAGGCATIDTIEIRRNGVVVQSIEDAGVLASAPWLVADRWLSEAALATPELAAECAELPAIGDERLNLFEVVLRGRVDGGQFEARCGGMADIGASPRTVLTCHENLPLGPEFANAYTSSPIGGTSELFVGLRNPPELQLLGVDRSVQILVVPTSGTSIQRTLWTDWDWAEVGFPSSDHRMVAATFRSFLDPLLRECDGSGDTVFIARFLGGRTGPDGTLYSFTSEVLVPRCTPGTGP